MKKRKLLKIIEYPAYFIFFSFLGSLIEFLFGRVYYDKTIFELLGIKIAFIPFYGMLFVILIALQKFMLKSKTPFYFWGLINAAIITLWELIWGLIGFNLFNHLIWNYSSHILNFKGIISLPRTIIWVMVGYLFSFLFIVIFKKHNYNLLKCQKKQKRKK